MTRMRMAAGLMAAALICSPPAAAAPTCALDTMSTRDLGKGLRRFRSNLDAAIAAIAAAGVPAPEADDAAAKAARGRAALIAALRSDVRNIDQLLACEVFK